VGAGALPVFRFSFQREENTFSSSNVHAGQGLGTFREFLQALFSAVRINLKARIRIMR